MPPCVTISTVAILGQRVIRSNHGPISYCFQDIRQFRAKIESFTHPVYLLFPLRDSPWNFITALVLEKARRIPYQVVKTFYRHVHLFRHNAGVLRTDGRTELSHSHTKVYIWPAKLWSHSRAG